MKVGVIVDGTAEAIALRELMPRLGIPGVEICGPYYADMQPYATPAQIVRSAAARLEICKQRGCGRFVVLIDFEGRHECPGVWAGCVADGFRAAGYVNISVVVKTRCFENWLIGDLDSLRIAYPKRYNFRDGVLGRITASGADNLQAATVLGGVGSGGYNKRKDAIEICKVIDPLIVAKHSRSFRRFLRTMCHPQYRGQSRLPCREKGVARRRRR